MQVLAYLCIPAAVMTAYKCSAVHSHSLTRQGAGLGARTSSGHPVRLRRLLPRRVRHRPLGENGRETDDLVGGSASFPLSRVVANWLSSISIQACLTRPMYRCSSLDSYLKPFPQRRGALEGAYSSATTDNTPAKVVA